MSISYRKRCGCRAEDGTQLGAQCPRIEERGHGTWSARVDLPRSTTGKRARKERGGFAKKSDAKQWAEELLEAHKRGARNVDHRITTGQWLERWLAAKTSTTGISGYGRTVRASTATMYRLYVDYLTEHIGHIPLQDLGVEDVVAAYEAIKKSSAERAERIDRTNELKNAARVATGEEPLVYAPAKRMGDTSMKRVHACLRAALQAAVKTGHKPYNPCLQVTFDQSPTPARVQPWSAAELGKFLAHVRGSRYGLLFEVLASSGVRRGEALGLRWHNVDAVSGTIKVEEQLLNKWADGAPVFGVPKSSAGGRVLALPRAIVESLRLLRLAQDEEREKWGDAYEDYGLVFCQENGRPYDPAKVSKDFVKLSAEAGLRRIRLHDLRHGATTLELEAGVPMAVVSKRRGHASVAFTVDVYGYLLEGADRQAAEAGWAGVATQPTAIEQRP